MARAKYARSPNKGWRKYARFPRSGPVKAPYRRILFTRRFLNSNVTLEKETLITRKNTHYEAVLYPCGHWVRYAGRESNRRSARCYTCQQLIEKYVRKHPHEYPELAAQLAQLPPNSERQLWRQRLKRSRDRVHTPSVAQNGQGDGL